MGVTALSFVYDGWQGYHESICDAVSDLTPEQLAFKGSVEMSSVGEIAWHIADGRVEWFRRMAAPKSGELAKVMEGRAESPLDARGIIDWLQQTWGMVEATLLQWTVDDLAATYHHAYQGKVYAVTKQWTIWRIMCHDIHHGGQLSELLAMQSIYPEKLTWLGGHLAEPKVVGLASS